MLYRFARWYVARADARAERRAVAAQNALFPPGTRVLITGICCTLRSPAGTLGTVEGPTSCLDDWWVNTDDGRREIYCAKGMRRA
jgi:hypothetical protein